MAEKPTTMWGKYVWNKQDGFRFIPNAKWFRARGFKVPKGLK